MSISIKTTQHFSSKSCSPSVWGFRKKTIEKNLTWLYLSQYSSNKIFWDSETPIIRNGIRQLWTSNSAWGTDSKWTNLSIFSVLQEKLSNPIYVLLTFWHEALRLRCFNTQPMVLIFSWHTLIWKSNLTNITFR